MMMPHTFKFLILILLGLLLVAPVLSMDDMTVNYDPKTGVYTHYWFDPTGPPNPINMIYSFFLPILNVIGPWMYFILWAAFAMAAWLYTQDITMPTVIGTITGAVMSSLMSMPEAQMMMILTMVFASGGLIAKVLLARQ